MVLEFVFLLQPGAEEDQEAKGACPKTWRRALDGSETPHGEIHGKNHSGGAAPAWKMFRGVFGGWRWMATPWEVKPYHVGSFCIAFSPLLCYLFCNGMWKGVRIGGMLNQTWYRYFRFIENPSTPGNRKSHPLAATWSNKNLCKGWILHLNLEGWIITGSLIESNDLASNKNECLPGVQCFSMKHVKLTWHGASMEDLDRYHGKVMMESFMCSEKSSWLHNFEVYQSLRWEKLQEDVAKPMPEPVPQFFELRLKSTCHQPRA